MLDEIGVVKYFDTQRGFGFLRALDAQGSEMKGRIYFHINDGRFTDPASTPDVPMLCVKDERPSDVPQNAKLATPFRGDKINFQRKEGKKGPMAAPWAFADRAQQVRTSKPKRRKSKRAPESAQVAVAA